jgi:hypothetical protein
MVFSKRREDRNIVQNKETMLQYAQVPAARWPAWVLQDGSDA